MRHLTTPWRWLGTAAWLPLVVGCGTVSLQPRSWQCTLATIVAPGSICQPLARAPEALDRDAKEFAPVPGQAKVYLVRPSIVGGHYLWDTQVDGRHAGVLAEHTYLVLVVPPGTHEVLVLAGDERHALALTTGAGELRFIEAAPRIGWTESRAALRLLERSQGEAEVRGSKLAAPL